MRRSVPSPVTRRRYNRQSGRVLENRGLRGRDTSRSPIARFRRLVTLSGRGSRLTISDLREIRRTSSYVGYSYAYTDGTGTERNRYAIKFLSTVQKSQIESYVGTSNLFPE